MSGGSTFSIIGDDVVITGNISAEVDLHIDGKVDGDIECAALVQGPSSEINGGITAQSARMAGTVNGSIDARELVIESTARISGDVAYDTLTIEQGGHIDGTFKFKGKTQSPQVAAALNGDNAAQPIPLRAEQAS